MGKNRYALLTVDTEALPKRATGEHVTRLMWGEHEKGSAGVREMSGIGDEFGAKHVFFFDMCGCFSRLDEELAVASWLHGAGQDVQLHAHPEYLPKTFWDAAKFRYQPRMLNQYRDAHKEEYVLSYFAKELAKATGEQPRAFRAGSFRWNALTLRTLKTLGISLNFSNSITAMNIGQCPYSVPTSKPFRWSNGIIEVPVTEKNILPRFCKDWWARFQYPLSDVVKYRPWWASFIPYSVSRWDGFLVCLIHSWSLLYWNEEGYAEYRDDARIEGYRKLVKTLTKDYDVITTADVLDLVNRGELKLEHVEDVANAELPTQPKPAAPASPKAPAAPVSPKISAAPVPPKVSAAQNATQKPAQPQKTAG